MTNQKVRVSKGIYLFGVAGIFLFMMIGMVSAWDFDNKLTYSNKDLKVDFKNSILGVIPTTDIGSVELKSHKSVDEVRQVRIGNPVTTWYDFDFKEIYKGGLGDITIIDMDSGEEVERDYSFVYWGNLTKEEIEYKCSKIISSNGSMGEECIEKKRKTITTNEQGWIDYNSRDISNKKIIIGVKVEIGFEETLDIIWEIVGKKLKKHAVVTSGAIETTDGIFTVLTYINDGTFNTTTDLDAEVLIIGGGGGESDQASRGGGGGNPL